MPNVEEAVHTKTGTDHELEQSKSLKMDSMCKQQVPKTGFYDYTLSHTLAGGPLLTTIPNKDAHDAGALRKSAYVSESYCCIFCYLYVCSSHN